MTYVLIFFGSIALIFAIGFGCYWFATKALHPLSVWLERKGMSSTWAYSLPLLLVVSMMTAGYITAAVYAARNLKP